MSDFRSDGGPGVTSAPSRARIVFNSSVSSAALMAAFNAAARAFGQSLYTSELLAVTQGVAGVIATTATIAGGTDPAIAQPPRFVGGTLALAGLVSIGDNTLTLTEMRP